MNEETSSNEYIKNYSPDRTYIGKAFIAKNLDGTVLEKRYITKVFDINDFQEYYKDLKQRKILKVIRDGQKQAVVAIVDRDARNFSLRIQRFTKKTGTPNCQSFSFHSGALIKLLEFIDSLGFIDFSNKSFFKLDDADIQKTKQFWLSNIDVIDNIKRFDSNLLKKIFGKIEDGKKIEYIVESLTDIDIEHLEAAVKQTNYIRSLKILEKLIQIDCDNSVDLVKEALSLEELKKYSAKQPEKIFQNWIEDNLWVFGVEYYKKYDWKIIDDAKEGSSKADLVMSTLDGFVDLIELKRPNIKSDTLLNYDEIHKSYFPSRALSLAFGQCLHYLKKLDEKKKEIEDKNSVKVLRPRIKLIIGRSNNFNEDEYKALRMLNSNLNHIQIITYDDLIKNAKQIISLYKK